MMLVIISVIAHGTVVDFVTIVSANCIANVNATLVSFLASSSSTTVKTNHGLAGGGLTA